MDAEIDERLPDLELKIGPSDADLQRPTLALPDLASQAKCVLVIPLEAGIRPLLLQLTDRSRFPGGFDESQVTDSARGGCEDRPSERSVRESISDQGSSSQRLQLAGGHRLEGHDQIMQTTRTGQANRKRGLEH